ncbi:hypothetical protein CCP3SC1_240007 [Gammaproteobacteria bacterium]
MNQWERWGCGVELKFPICKLIDYQKRWAELEMSSNTFALVVMAQLKVLRILFADQIDEIFGTHSRQPVPNFLWVSDNEGNGSPHNFDEELGA